MFLQAKYSYDCFLYQLVIMLMGEIMSFHVAHLLANNNGLNNDAELKIKG